MNWGLECREGAQWWAQTWAWLFNRKKDQNQSYSLISVCLTPTETANLIKINIFLDNKRNNQNVSKHQTQIFRHFEKCIKPINKQNVHVVKTWVPEIIAFFELMLYRMSLIFPSFRDYLRCCVTCSLLSKLSESVLMKELTLLTILLHFKGLVVRVALHLHEN